MRIEGLYEDTMYYDTRTGYSIFRVKLFKHNEDGERFVICSGIAIKYAPGIPLCIDGEEEITARGKILRATSITLDVKNEQLFKLYITSCLPLGMGQAAAGRIARFFATNDLSIEEFLNKPERYDLLMTVNGISAAKCNSIIKKMSESADRMNLLSELAPYGLSYKQIENLYILYGGQCMKEMREDPYKTMRKANIPFENADYFAQINGLSYVDPRRVSAMVSYMFFSMGNTGNCYMLLDEIIDYFRQIEKHVSRYVEEIPQAIFMLELACNKAGFIDNKETLHFYSRAAWNTENNIVKELLRLSNDKTELLDYAHVSKYANEKAIHLDETQKTALYLFEDTKPAFLIGGPGTGKTTTIKEIVACCYAKNPEMKITLCAPTGRAAERIKEATGYSATTIHMLLEYCTFGGQNHVMKNAQNPLDTDVLIIDEFSLVGIYLFLLVLQAIPTGTKILLVGDWNQLPSIEPGFLLHDLVKSECFKYVFLKKVHRQALKNPIIFNSKNISEKKMYIEDLKQDDAFKIIGFESNEKMKECLKNVYLDRANTPSFINDFHVITPMRNGKCSTNEINQMAQAILHNSEEEEHISRGDEMFFWNEKVMTIRNNYTDIPYFNGDIWTVDKFIENESLNLRNEDSSFTKIEWDNLDDVELAYAMTIHKCQGSEAKEIILILPEGIHPRMITRSILFTAITRAKEAISIYYVKDMLDRYLQSEMHNSRKSGITKKVISAFAS